MRVQSGGVLLERDRIGARTEHGWFWHDVLVPFVITRLVLAAIGFLAVNAMPMAEHSEIARVPMPRAWMGAWARWDAVWYMRIVRDGYFYEPGEQSSVAFFPLYPMLMKAGGYLTGNHPVGWMQSGILVANVLFLIAMAYLWKLVRLDFDEGAARRAVFYAIIAPTTFFFSAAYPMSLILAIGLGAFYYARVKNWWAAGFLAALAPLARPDGVLLVPGLLFEYLRQREFKWRAIRGDAAGILLLPGVTLLGWMAFLHLRFGDALAFVHVQKAWPASPIWTAREDWDAMVGVLAAGTALVAIVIGWFRLRSSYMVYASLHWLLLVSVPRFASLGRFVLVLFPVYIVLAMLGKDSRFDRFWTIACSAVGSVLFLRFSLCYFVG